MPFLLPDAAFNSVHPRQRFPAHTLDSVQISNGPLPRP